MTQDMNAIGEFGEGKGKEFQAVKEVVRETVEKDLQELLEIRTELYEHPEVGGEEVHSSALLVKSLKNHGFQVEELFHQIPNAFRAEFNSEKEGPVIGIMCEFDALPEIGHGCGHNVIAATSLGAAYALKEAAARLGGKVIVYGTPGEECLCTKVQLSEEGAFDEADVAMMVHPNPCTEVGGSTLAIEALQVEFYGKSSHAGTSPEQGINALDAAVMCYTAINMEKQYLKGSNIYGIINDGGSKASVIPEYASMKYLLRTPTSRQLRMAEAMVRRCAEGAAAAVGAKVKVWNNEPSNLELWSNQAMSSVFAEYLEELGVEDIRFVDSNGSTDLGDVSHQVPTIHPWLGLNCETLQLHSKAFADQTETEEGARAIRVGAAAMAMTGARVLASRELLAQIKEEFQKRKSEEEEE